jgi:glycosyltransferase involved in cell wall biosynthesis
MRTPEFSVVVPLYNKEREIGRCIRSVLDQSFPDFELIVVDDGSTDRSADVVRCFNDPRIRLIEKRNGGPASARNRGIEEAKAKLIAFLDADDQWLPGFLRTIMDLVSVSPEAGAYFTAFWIHRGGGWARKVTIQDRYTRKGEPILRDYFATPSGHLSPSAFVVWKSIFDKTGAFRELFGEDVDLWLRIAAFYPIGYSGSAQAIWNVNATNRRCIKFGRQNQSPKSCGLMPSLGMIRNAPGIPETTKEKALAYVAKRDLRAILPVNCREGRYAAQHLLELWQVAYGKAPSHVLCLLYVPQKLLQSFEFARMSLSKCLVTCAYLRDRRRTKKVISIG